MLVAICNPHVCVTTVD